MDGVGAGVAVSDGDWVEVVEVVVSSPSSNLRSYMLAHAGATSWDTYVYIAQSKSNSDGPVPCNAVITSVWSVLLRPVLLYTVWLYTYCASLEIGLWTNVVSATPSNSKLMLLLMVIYGSPELTSMQYTHIAVPGKEHYSTPRGGTGTAFENAP